MKKTGFFLVGFSFLPYGLLFLVPFLEVSVISKGFITTGLIVVGEISFWVGGVILGKETISKIKTKLRIRKLKQINKNNE